MNLFKTYTGDQVPKSTKWIYSSVSFARDAAYALVSAFLVIYITYSGVLSTGNVSEYIAQYTVITFFIVAARLWDGINDPIMGWIVEKARFKMGKYKPWILIGGVLNTIIILCFFLLRPQGWTFVVMFCILYLLWDIVFTMNDIGYWSMLPSLTSDEKQRANITTLMAIFISLGTFAVYGAVPLFVKSGTAARDYAIIAVIVSVIFLISQLALVFFCKERERDPKQEEISEKAKFSDMFKMLKTNTQLRYSAIAILLYYCGSSIVVGFGLNYFYLVFGYGEAGGGVQFIFTVMFAIGTLAAQLLFPIMKKRFKLKRVFDAGFIILLIGYVILLLFGFPVFGSIIALKHTWIIYIGGILIFFGQGFFNLVLLLYMQNSIEYNELETGERKEATAFSIRPLTAKFGSALQQAVLWGTLLISGVFGVANYISNFEAVSNAYPEGIPEGIDFSIEGIEEQIAAITNSQYLRMSLGMIIVPVLLLGLAYFFIKKFYFIDEKKYSEILEGLQARKLGNAVKIDEIESKKE